MINQAEIKPKPLGKWFVSQCVPQSVDFQLPSVSVKTIKSFGQTARRRTHNLGVVGTSLSIGIGFLASSDTFGDPSNPIIIFPETESL